MNPFKEYVTMSLKGLKNFDKVLEGMKNETANTFKTLSKEKKEIISARMDICLDCPFSSGNAKTSNEYKELTGNNYESSRSELHCSLCGCVTTFKVASLSSSCGIEDWNLNNPAKQLPLKWQAIQ
jgi:hypothetical protein